jgi:hypothetical protein
MRYALYVTSGAVAVETNAPEAIPLQFTTFLKRTSRRLLVIPGICVSLSPAWISDASISNNIL